MKNLATNHKTYYGIGGFSGVLALLVNFGNSHCSVPVEDWTNLLLTLVPMVSLAVGAYFHGKGKSGGEEVK
jgi:hypothetical protein